MQSYIQELRKRTPAEKRRFALTFSACVTGLILLVWAMVNFSPSIRISQDGEGPVQLAAVAKNDYSIFQTLFSGIGEVWGNFLSKISNGK